jgi:xylose dehydrogenase (NAD/NADP)
MTFHMEVDTSPVRWGFIGVGMLAQRATAAAVHEGEGIELFAAAARDAQRAATINPGKVHATYDDLLSDPEVDAVYISLNNDAHFPYIEASLHAGKHVLCEKPMTMSAADTTQAYALAEERGLLLSEATWSLWSPRMRRINQLVAQGAVGSPRNYLSTFTFSGIPEDNYRLAPEQGGGALFDVGIYPLHGIVALLPEETLYSVTSASADNAGYRVDMTTKAQISWETPDGNRGSGAIVASFDMHPSQRFMIKGTDGEISIPDDQSFTQWHEAGDLIVNGAVESFPAVNPYRLMFEQFSKCIRNQGGWVPGPWQSIRVAEIVEEIQARAN